MERIFKKNKQIAKRKMNKKEFLNELKEHLVMLPKEDIDEIIGDYDEHFKIGEKEKRKESEIANSLGSPKEIARQVRKELNKSKDSVALESGLIEFWVSVKKTSKKVYNNLKKEIPNAIKALSKAWNSILNKKEKKSKKRNAWAIIGIIVLNLIIIIPLWIYLFSINISIILIGISTAISGIFTIFAAIFSISMPFVNSLTNLFLSGLFAGIALICLGIIFTILFTLLLKQFFKITKKYLNWNKKIFKGNKK